MEGGGWRPGLLPVRHPQDSSAVRVEVLTFASFEPQIPPTALSLSFAPPILSL